VIEPAASPLIFGGRYRVLEKLGSGGMADVYLAEQTSLGRKVALKVLRRNVATSPGMVERFRREALLLSTVDHPNVVRVLDFEAGDDGTALVLEYVEGQRLDALVESGPVPLSRAIYLLRQLARGLAAIHALGIVHRDLKPENVVLTRGPEGVEIARLLDFGVARLLEPVDSPADGRGFVTQSGVGTGTPAYISPEQVRGLPPDPRSDVYAFGVTAYLVLTGRLPFPGPRLEDYLKQHTEESPATLSTWAPDVAGAEPKLAELVVRCLAKEPKDRPADGRALLEELEASVTPEMVMTQEIISDAEVGRRSPALVVLAVLVSLLMGAAPAAAVVQPWTRVGQAQLALAMGQPQLALDRLGDAAQDDNDAAAARLRALQATGRTDEVKALLAKRCLGALLSAQPQLPVSAVAQLLPPGPEGTICQEAAHAAQ